MIPLMPSDRISIGPVTVADMSARSRSLAERAASRRSIAGPWLASSEKSKVPAPETVPLSAVLPVRLAITSRDPEKVPRVWTPEMSVPVRLLCRRRPLLASEPRITGDASVPVTSAATVTGPVRSKVLIAARRHKASAGPS